MASIDHNAVAQLGLQTVDWRFRSLPPDAQGLSLRALAKQKRDIFTGGFIGPILTLDTHAVAHNISIMAGWCRDHRVDLAPHGKTTMAPQLIASQIQHGAWGVTAATVAQVRVLRAFGVTPIILANEVVDPAGLRWMAAEQDRDLAARILCWVDSVEGVARIERALSASSPARPLEVLIEFGGWGGRAGCRTFDHAELVAAEVQRSPVVRLAGVAGYEGVLVHAVSQQSTAVVDRYLDQLYGLASQLASGGFFDDCGEIILTAGGSSYFDRVPEHKSADVLDGLPVRVILRSGCYLTHDDGYYKRSTPAVRNVAGAPTFRPALRVWSQVSSHPEPTLALLGMGRRDVAYDQGLPSPIFLRRDGADITPLADRSIAALDDQHAYLTLDANDLIEVGDWIGAGISHPCSVFDRWKVAVVVDGTEAVDFVTTIF